MKNPVMAASRLPKRTENRIEKHLNALSKCVRKRGFESHTAIPSLAIPNKAVPYLLLLAISKALGNIPTSAHRPRAGYLPSDCT